MPAKPPAGPQGLEGGTSRCSRLGGYPGDELAVFGGVDALLQLPEGACEVSVQKRGKGQPQAGEDAAAHHAGVVGGQGAVVAVRQFEPVDALLLSAPDDVLLHTVRYARSLSCRSIDALLAATSTISSGAPST